MQLIKNRFAQSDRYLLDEYADAAAHGISGFAYTIYEIDHFLGRGRVSATDDVAFADTNEFVDRKRFQIRCFDFADARDMREDTDARLGKETFCHRTGRHPGSRLTCGRTATAAVVADTVLYLVGIVSMRRAVFVLDM